MNKWLQGWGPPPSGKPQRPPPPRRAVSQDSASMRSDVVDDTVVIEPEGSGFQSKGPGDDFESVSFTTSYCGEWERLFTSPTITPGNRSRSDQLRSYGIKGKLRSCRFRSVCWKVYLGVLPDDINEWVQETRVWREKYTALRQKLVTNPREQAAALEETPLTVNNPLSQEQESPWNQYFQDNELRLTIKQDVVRTFPELQFYKDSNLRERMVNILFLVARTHRNMYRQGMHELLAPLIFVLHCDHQAFLHACEIESVGEIVKEVMDPTYIEHDAFAMFCRIMAVVEPWYVSQEYSPVVSRKDVTSATPFAEPSSADFNPTNMIVAKLARIQDHLLKKYDPELLIHLEKMEILPQLYGIRWLRLLFGREFPMQDLLVVWDAIFADDNDSSSRRFELVEFLFLAMMLYLRDALLSSDYATCLSFLMKYPPVGDVQYFVQKALYLRNPMQHPCPPNIMYHKPANYQAGGYGTESGGVGFPSQIRGSQLYGRHTGGGSNTVHGLAEKATGLMTGFSTLTRKLGNTAVQNRPRNLTGSPRKISKSSSEPDHLITDESPSSSGVDPWRYLFTSRSRPGATSRGRKGSTASMSQLEDSVTPHPAVTAGLRPTASAASLTDRMDSSGGYSGLSTPQSPAHRGAGRRGSKKRSEQMDMQEENAILRARINSMESMCQQCSDKMDIHIAVLKFRLTQKDKLQQEMLNQPLLNEDELLLALAGLKQVRDVLKGILKPGAILDGGEEMPITQEHFFSPRTKIRSLPGPNSTDSKLGSPAHRFYTGATTESSENSSSVTSPEYDPSLDFSIVEGEGLIDPGETFEGHCVSDYGRARNGNGHQQYPGDGGSNAMKNNLGRRHQLPSEDVPLPPEMKNKPEIELKDFQKQLHLSENACDTERPRTSKDNSEGLYDDNPNPVYLKVDLNGVVW